jgi:hypothetical protein
MERARRRSERATLVEDRGVSPDPNLHLDAEGELRTLSYTPTTCDDGPEFSSEPMPGAFPAVIFLGIGVLICLLLVFLL